MKIANTHVVSFHYKLTDDEGTTLDSSEGRDPLTYLHGTGSIIPGLEAELEGREAGDRFTARIEPKDAYGEPDPNLLQEVPLSMLSAIENLAVGMQLQSQSQSGHVQVLTVAELRDESAILDANHALAGVALTFDVAVEGVREATEEEIAHGHAH